MWDFFSFALPDLLGDLSVLSQITVIFLQDEARHSLPLIIGSSVAGLLVLIVIIVILFKVSSVVSTQPLVLGTVLSGTAGPDLRAATLAIWRLDPLPSATHLLGK